jgi:hypothetical protein
MSALKRKKQTTSPTSSTYYALNDVLQIESNTQAFQEKLRQKSRDLQKGVYGGNVRDGDLHIFRKEKRRRAQKQHQSWSG